jgi:predicted RNA binding protein YcfA (HicA-like mRNA interferase family)
MPTTEALIETMRRSPNNMAFSDLVRVVKAVGFVFDRQKGSHQIFARPGFPRINLQAAGGKAKPYQVRQVLALIDTYHLGE